MEDLNSVDFGRRNQAIKRLLEEKPRRHAVAVAKALERVLLEDDHPSLRANAALALASWGTAESTAALRRQPPGIRGNCAIPREKCNRGHQASAVTWPASRAARGRPGVREGGLR